MLLIKTWFVSQDRQFKSTKCTLSSRLISANHGSLEVSQIWSQTYLTTLSGRSEDRRGCVYKAFNYGAEGPWFESTPGESIF